MKHINLTLHCINENNNCYFDTFNTRIIEKFKYYYDNYYPIYEDLFFINSFDNTHFQKVHLNNTNVPLDNRLLKEIVIGLKIDNKQIHFNDTKSDNKIKIKLFNESVVNLNKKCEGITDKECQGLCDSLGGVLKIDNNNDSKLCYKYSFSKVICIVVDFQKEQSTINGGCFNKEYTMYDDLKNLNYNYNDLVL